MAGSLGRLTAQLDVNVTRFERALTRAERTAQRRSRAIQTGLNQVKLALGGVVTGLAIRSLVRWTTETINAADAIGKMAKQTGLTAVELQKYQFAAGQAGIETGKFQKGVGDFNRRLGELKEGTGALLTFLNKYDEAFIPVLTGAKSTGEAFRLLTERMATIPDEATRAALGYAAFGRQGAALSVLLAQGTEVLDEYGRTLESTGAIMSNEAVQDAEDAKDAFDRLEKSTAGLGRALTLKLAPGLTAVADAFTELLTGVDPDPIGTMADEIGRLHGFLTNIAGSDSPLHRFQVLISGLFSDPLATIPEHLGNVTRRIQQLSFAHDRATQPVKSFTVELKKEDDAAEDTADTITRELHPGIVAYADEVERLLLLQRQTVQKTLEHRQAMQDELAVLQTRIEGGDQAAEVERLWIQARNEGIGVTREEILEFVQAKQSLQDYIDETDDAARRWEQIWSTAIDDMQRAFGDTIYNALWEDGIESFGDFVDAIVDIWKQMIARMLAAWITSGIAGIFAGEGFAGFSLGGLTIPGIGGKKIVEGGKKIVEGGKKILGIGGTSAARTFPLTEAGGGITRVATFGGGSAAAATAAGASTAFGAPAAAGTGATIIYPGTGAATSGFSLSQFAAANPTLAGIGALAVPFTLGSLFSSLKGPSSADIARSNLERGLFATGGPLGLSFTSAKGNPFFAGPNARFAAQFFRDQAGFELRTGRGESNRLDDPSKDLGGFFNLQGVKDVDELLARLEEAEETFENLKSTGEKVFGDIGISAAKIGDIIRDGTVTELEQARLGVVSLGDISATEFGRLITAVDDGTLRLEAFRGEVALNEREVELFGQLGFDSAQLVALGFEIASTQANDAIDSFVQNGIAGAKALQSAFNAAAAAAAGVGSGSSGSASTARQVTIKQQLQRNATQRRGPGEGK